MVPLVLMVRQVLEVDLDLEVLRVEIHFSGLQVEAVLPLEELSLSFPYKS